MTTRRPHPGSHSTVVSLLLVVGLGVGYGACGADSVSGSGAAGNSGAAGTAGIVNGGSANLGGSTSAAGSLAVSGASSSMTVGGGGSSAGAGVAGAGGSGAGGAGAGSAGQSSAGSSGSAGAGGGSMAACPMPQLKAGDTDRTLQAAGNSRPYKLHVPASYDGTKPVPLILDFHGLGGDGPGERGSSPYPAQTDADGVIMAFPTGLAGPSGNAWNVGPCCVKNTDDVAFAKALVADIEKTACIDTKRVYAVGFSMGGGMSHYLACHAADVFAAVAPAAFDLLKENVDDCKPQRPISVISFRSTGDGVVNYAGAYSAVVQGMPINFLGAKATFDKWAALNQCTGAASAEDANGCATYAGCPGSIDVVLCTKQGGTHEPGNAKVAWPLLKKHTLP